MAERPRVELAAHGDDVIVLSPIGDFDVDGAEHLRAAFSEAVTPTRHKIVVDLSATTFLDSMALGTLIGVAKRAQGWGGWLRLIRPVPYVSKVLRVTGLDTAFGVFTSVEEAVAHQAHEPS